jgi:hypothetical protein
MTEKKVDITGRYNREIQEIKYIFQDLENGRVYDITRTRGDAYLHTHVANLRKKLNDLITKVEYDKDSIDEDLAAALFEARENDKF